VLYTLFEDKHTPRLNLKTRLFQLPTKSFAFSGGSRIFFENFAPVFPEKKMSTEPRVCRWDPCPRLRPAMLHGAAGLSSRLFFFSRGSIRSSRGTAAVTEGGSAVAATWAITP